MPDSRPDPELGPGTGTPPGVAAESARRRQRGRNLALFITLLAWALVMYIAVMVKIHNDIRPG